MAAWQQRVIIALLCAASTATGGCGESRSGGASVERDSAGIRIVESSVPAWDEGDEWALSPQPVVAIGVMDGPEEYQLERLVGAVRAGDRGIVVADGGANVVRAYSDEGSFLWSVGRLGSGPGEFRRLDELYLYDRPARER